MSQLTENDAQFYEFLKVITRDEQAELELLFPKFCQLDTIIQNLQEAGEFGISYNSSKQKIMKKAWQLEPTNKILSKVKARFEGASVVTDINEKQLDRVLGSENDNGDKEHIVLIPIPVFESIANKEDGNTPTKTVEVPFRKREIEPEEIESKTFIDPSVNPRFKSDPTRISNSIKTSGMLRKAMGFNDPDQQKISVIDGSIRRAGCIEHNQKFKILVTDFTLDNRQIEYLLDCFDSTQELTDYEKCRRDYLLYTRTKEKNPSMTVEQFANHYTTFTKSTMHRRIKIGGLDEEIVNLIPLEIIKGELGYATLPEKIKLVREKGEFDEFRSHLERCISSKKTEISDWPKFLNQVFSKWENGSKSKNKKNASDDWLTPTTNRKVFTKHVHDEQKNSSTITMKGYSEEVREEVMTLIKETLIKHGHALKE